MKIVLALLIILSSGLFGNEAERLMQEANHHYQQNQYDKSAELYIQILNNGYESDELYYNLGNAYFKTGRLGYAILYYEKALKLAPNDDDINYNLEIANARAVDKIEVLPKLFFVKWGESFLNFFSVSGWSYFTYFVYLLLLISIAAYFLVRKPSMQKIAVFSSAGLIAVLVICIIILAFKVNYESSNYGVVVEQVVTAKLSPDQQSGDAFIIHEGLKVGLEDQVSEWVKIKLADGKVGWIPDSELRRI